MSDGNKNNNGVHEVGTEETRLAYQNDTPGQQVERYLNTINQVIEEKKEKQKKAFTKVFDNPLKGFPYNETLDDSFVDDIQEAPKLKNLIPEFEKIVKTKGAAKVQGTMVDMFTASVIVKAYEQVNDKNKKRMETSNVFTLIKLAQKVMGMKEETDIDEYSYSGQRGPSLHISKMTGTRQKAVQDFLDSEEIDGEKLLKKLKKNKKLLKTFAMALSGKPGNKFTNQFTEETVSEAMKIKDIFKKHKRELTKAYKTGDLSFSGSAGKKAEDDLTTWAMDNNEIKTDDPDEFFDWLSRDLEDIVKGKIREETVSEKVEYAEYKFKNKKDAQKALDYFKSQQRIKLDINDDGLSQGELAIDAGNKDMTKQHKEVLKMFKPKVLTTEGTEQDASGEGTPNKDDVHLPTDARDDNGVLSEGKMSELFLDIQQGATAKDIARDYPVTLAQAKDFLKDYYGQKKKPMNMGEGMQSSKLTGQEISVYFKRNKVRDAETRKAVEFALDHGGAYSYAIKGIEKMKKGLSKNKDVVKALNFANYGESVKVPSVGFQFKEDSPVAGNMQVEGDPYIPQKKGVNKNIANYWNKEIKGLKDKELEAIQSMYMITDHSGVVQMYKAGKRDFIKSIKS